MKSTGLIVAPHTGLRHIPPGQGHMLSSLD
jgi:hypothetical protein